MCCLFLVSLLLGVIALLVLCFVYVLLCVRFGFWFACCCFDVLLLLLLFLLRFVYCVGLRVIVFVLLRVFQLLLFIVVCLSCVC